MANKLKMIRENEANIAVENIGSRDLAFTKEELSEVIYAIIRKLNYLYDLADNEERRGNILDKKSRLMLQLIYLEEIVDKLNYPNSKSRTK